VGGADGAGMDADAIGVPVSELEPLAGIWASADPPTTTTAAIAALTC
jgi:hypothetical protein